MPLPTAFLSKPEAQLRHELAGLPRDVQAAVLRLRERAEAAEVEALLPGLIAYHLPSGSAPPLSPLPPSARLREDLGLDSLALAELAYKLDEVFGVPIESHEVAGVRTVEELRSFLRVKLGLEPDTAPLPGGAS